MARCPVCGDSFGSFATVREHAWTAHKACHYCGDRLDDENARYLHWLVDHGDELARSDRKRAEAAVDSVTVRDRITYQGLRGALGDARFRRRAIITGGTIAIGVGIGGSIVTDLGPVGGSQSESATDDPAGPVATAPLPASPGEYQYAVMGAPDADLTITYFGSWKCPYCAQFTTGFLPTLVREYVVPATIAIQYRNLTYIRGKPFLGPDAPAAGHAGLAVWHTDPQSYWAYHEYVMQHQPSKSSEWATPERLATFARNASVSDPGAVRRAVTNQRYTAPLKATWDAAARAGVDRTPQLLIDGETVSPFDEDATRRLIETAVRG